MNYNLYMVCLDSRVWWMSIFFGHQMHLVKEKFVANGPEPVPGMIP